MWMLPAHCLVIGIIAADELFAISCTKEFVFLNVQFCRDKIREYRDESERFDQCSRLYDSSISNVNFELDASRIAQVRIFCHCPNFRGVLHG